MDQRSKGLPEDDRKSGLGQICVLPGAVMRSVEGHQRVDADDQITTGLERQRRVHGADQRAVHIMFAVDVHGFIQSRQRRACRHRARDRDVRVRVVAEGHAFAAVEARGHHEQARVQSPEIVGPSAGAKHRAQIALERRVVEQRGGQHLPDGAH